MNRSRTIQCLAIGALVLCSASMSHGQLNNFTEYQWIGGTGTQNWQDIANWDQSDFPGTFPNDTDSMDGIYPTANLQGAHGSNLNVNVGITPVTVAGLKLGSTTGAITTEISSSDPNGILTFRNDESIGLGEFNDGDYTNEGVVNGGDFLVWARNFSYVNTEDINVNFLGDANHDDDVDDLDLGIWQSQFGLGNGLFADRSAFIVSGGEPGSVNTISAPVFIDRERLEIDPQNPLTFDASSEITTLTGSINVVGEGTVIVNSDIIISDSDADPMTSSDDVGLNTSTRSKGTLVINGQIRMTDPTNPGRLVIGGLNTDEIPSRVEIYSSTDYNGNVYTGSQTILLGHDNALGVNSLDSTDFARVITSGGTFHSDNDSRTIPNNVLLQDALVVAGDHSMTMTGLITQTNNEALVNDVAAGKTLTVAGTIAIWGDDDTDPPRELDIRGSGTTVITGEIRSWDPQVIIDNPSATPPTYAGLNKEGSGVLLIDVAAGDNEHSGDTVVGSGYLRYADNDSLNVGSGRIYSRSGVVGVDTGVASNSAFNAKIDPESDGGLMIPAHEAAATFDFTSTLSNAGNMTLAAPETDLVFTGTIVPANSTYGLGGGSSKLTLPNVTLTGANNLHLRNGGIVELLGDNTYTGYTRLISGGNTLVVDDLADGGVASSIGMSTSDATNLEIQNSTIRYIGTGDTTDRLFTISTRGGTIDSSGTGALIFDNPGSILMKDAPDLIGDLDDFTGTNTPNRIYNVVGDTSDIVSGMSVSDPDPDFVFGAPNSCGVGNADPCIPAGTTVTGTFADGDTIALSNDYPFIQKVSTRIEFGTLPRTFTLSGTNTDDNEIVGVIGDSAKGGIVNLNKNGSGKWILSGANTYTGSTTVNDGILSITSAFLNDTSTITIASGAILDLDFSAVINDVVGAIILDGVELDPGVYNASTHPTFFSGTGNLEITVLAALATVPEPSSLLLISVASVSLMGRRSLFRFAS